MGRAAVPAARLWRICWFPSAAKMAAVHEMHVAGRAGRPCPPPGRASVPASREAGGARPPVEPQSSAGCQRLLGQRGPKGPRGLRGCLTGALRNQGTFDFGALIERSTGEAPLRPLRPLCPLRPTHLQQFQTSGVCLENDSYIVELCNCGNTQCGIIHCFRDAFWDPALADG